MCIFNVVLCPMLGLLSIFFDALYKVLFSFLFVAITIIVALSVISMKFYAKGKLYPFSNLVRCNPFALFFVMCDNVLWIIIFCHFILLIVYFVLLCLALNSLAPISHLFLNLSFWWNGVFCLLTMILLWYLS
jgi:hypothetical protein